MAKYVKSNTGCVVVDPSPYVAAQCEPVVVIPEADWKRLVGYCEGWTRKETKCPSKSDDIEIDAIIQRTEEANNG